MSWTQEKTRVDQDGRTTISLTKLGTHHNIFYFVGLNLPLCFYREYSEKHSEENINKVIQQACEEGLNICSVIVT